MTSHFENQSWAWWLQNLEAKSAFSQSQWTPLPIFVNDSHINNQRVVSSKRFTVLSILPVTASHFQVTEDPISSVRCFEACKFKTKLYQH